MLDELFNPTSLTFLLNIRKPENRPQPAHQANMQGTLTSTHDETVETFLLDWLRDRVQPRVRERTYHNYQQTVSKHILPTLGQIKLQQLNAMHIQKLYDGKRQQLSPRSIHHIHTIIRRALDDGLEALYVLAITTGMRQGELLALTWNNLDFTSRAVSSRAKEAVFGDEVDLLPLLKRVLLAVLLSKRKIEYLTI